MRPDAHPAATREILAAAALCALMLAVPSPSEAGPRPGLEAGALWGGMSGADRLASGGDEVAGRAGAFGALRVEFAGPGRWGMVTGVRYREVREHAPTGLQFVSGGLDYAYRLNTTVDLVSLPALARVRPARSSALSLELGPQLNWVTHARSHLSWERVGSSPAPTLPRNGGARTEAQIFELLSGDPTAHYRNLVVEGVAGIVLEAPGVAHPPFLALRWTGGISGIVGGSMGNVRRMNVIELGAGWRW